ncbi:conjugal transfer protein TraO [Acinetobacter junii]|nr:conjugal transfer protein TraO [Acinetobacter junii]
MMSEVVQKQQGRQSVVVIVAIVVVVLALLYIVYTYATSDNGAQGSSVSGIQNTRGSESKESERYSEVLNQYNNQESAKAEQEKSTYLSVLSTNATDVNAQPQPQLPPPPQPVEVQYAPAPQQQYATQQQPEQQDDKQLIAQVDGMMKTWAAKGHGAAIAADDGKEYAASIQRVNGSSAGNGGTGTNASVQKIVDDFALVPAILNTDLDTDENSVVTATIPAGKYKGAVLYAMGYNRVTNTIDMTFTAMRFNGKSYKVNAKPVDQTTSRTALSGDVNNRYFTRIVIPAIATGLGRAGQLYSQAASQNIITSNGAIVQTYPETPSGKAVGGTIAGGMAEQTGRVLASDAAQMPIKRVSVKKGTTIGIQFIGPVLSSDEYVDNANQIQTGNLSTPASPANTRYPMPQSNNNNQQYGVTYAAPYPMPFSGGAAQ